MKKASEIKTGTIHSAVSIEFRLGLTDRQAEGHSQYCASIGVVRVTIASRSLEMHVAAELLQQTIVFHRRRVFAKPCWEHNHLTHRTSHHVTRYNIRKHCLYTQSKSVSKTIVSAGLANPGLEC